MDRRLFLLSSLAGALAVPLTAGAQRRPEVRRIGYLHADLGGLPAGFYEILRDGLHDLGYLQGRNLVIEHRSGDSLARLAELATELVRVNVEVIVTPGAAIYAAKRATETIPIVFSYSGDPIEAGFVKSLGRPGGNMTGITWLAFELVGKRLELLMEAVPRMSRVAVLANPAHPGEQRELGETEKVARAVGATVQYHQVRTTPDFRVAFDAIVRDNANALLVFPDGVTMAHRRQMAEFAAKHRLPSVFGWREYVEAGGLMARSSARLKFGEQEREQLIATLMAKLGHLRDLLATGPAEERKAVVRTFLQGISIDKAKSLAVLRWYRLPQEGVSVKLVAVGGIEPPTRGL